MKIVSAIVVCVTAGLAMGAVAIAAPPAPSGEQLFKQRCQMCHTVTPNVPGPLAPSLAGVVGRKAVSTGFASYSPALKVSKVVWTKPNLDRFLTAPAKMVPGTRMVIAVSDPAQRAALIAYLSTKR